MARTVKCPSCGAELTVKEGNRDFMFCEYCGTKVRLDDYQETHRFVDEARIQESKDAKELEMKRIEFEKWKKEEENNDKKNVPKQLAICFGTLILFMFVMWLMAMFMS